MMGSLIEIIKVKNFQHFIGNIPRRRPMGGPGTKNVSHRKLGQSAA